VLALAAAMPQPGAAQTPPFPAFSQGFANRQSWVTWVNGLSDHRHDGAIFWAGQRSQASWIVLRSAASEQWRLDYTIAASSPSSSAPKSSNEDDLRRAAECAVLLPSLRYPGAQSGGNATAAPMGFLRLKMCRANPWPADLQATFKAYNSDVTKAMRARSRLTSPSNRTPNTIW